MPVVNSKPPLEPRRHDQENVVIILKDFLKGFVPPRKMCVTTEGSFFGNAVDFEWESKLKQLGFQEMFGSWQSFDLIGFFKSQNW